MDYKGKKMKLTNNYDLPSTLYKAISWQRDEPKDYEYRVTELISPPRIVQLTRRHDNAIEEDISERIWILLGNAVHYVLEKGQMPNSLVEERLTAKINGITIKGRPDLWEADCLWDYKVTSTWSVVFSPKGKPDWVSAINIYKWLYEQNGFKVEEAFIMAFLRDWIKAKRKEPGYPKLDVAVIPVKFMDNIPKYIEERIYLHEIAKNLPDHDLPMCTKEERWEDETKYALMKKGQKRAVRLFPTELAANMALESIGKEHYVEERIGTPKRCLEYCPVFQWCHTEGK